MRKIKGVILIFLSISLSFVLLCACFGGDYTVTFDSMGGNEIASKQTGSSKTVGRPEDPIKEGYEFVGWYRDKECNDVWSFNNDTVSKNITLYAKWTKCFESGTGLEKDPFLIAKSYQLKYMSKHLNAHFRLTGDIDCSDLMSFSPIGNKTYPFTGWFFGDGYKISNLIISGRGSSSGFDAQGFFGYINGGYVFDLDIENIKIDISETANVNRYIGGIAGYAVNSQIENCKVSGTITGQYRLAQNKTSGGINIGGIVGRLGENPKDSHATVEDCVSTATISGGAGGESYAGGIIGHGLNFSISRCYSSGDVMVTGSHNAFAGGVIGYAAKGNVSNCLATGQVSSTANGLLRNSYIGGLVGIADSVDGYSIFFDNCIAAGKVTSNTKNASAVYKGGFVAFFNKNLNTECILKCINSKDDTQQSNFCGNPAVFKNSDAEYYDYDSFEMRDADNFSDWSWSNWIIEDGRIPKLDI